MDKMNAYKKAPEERVLEHKLKKQ